MRNGDGHMQADRRHGTRAYYMHGCRCDACKAANMAYVRKYKREYSENRRRTLPADTTRGYLKQLQDAGLEHQTVRVM